MATNGNGKNVKILGTLLIMLLGGLLGWTHWYKFPSVDSLIRAEGSMRAKEDIRVISKIDRVEDIVTDIRIEQGKQMTILKRLDK